LSYSATNLPVNAVFNAATRTLTWTPGYDQAGVYTVMFSVSDGILSDTKNANITVKNVNRAPVMTTIPATTTDEGKLLTITVNAADPDGDTLSYSATNLPVNAVFNAATRTLTWTPGYDPSGVYTVTFSVSDGVLSDTKNANITVRNANGNVPIRTSTPAPTLVQTTPRNVPQKYYILLQ